MKILTTSYIIFNKKLSFSTEFGMPYQVARCRSILQEHSTFLQRELTGAKIMSLTSYEFVKILYCKYLYISVQALKGKTNSSRQPTY